MRNFLILSILITAFTVSGQKVDLEDFKGMNMRALGPGTMSGRVTSIDVVKDQPEVIYIGTASGGLWKSESGGVTWEPLFDDEDVMSIGSVAINQSNIDEVWAGTGEGNPRNSHTSGAGIYKSINAGKTWELMGLEATKTIHRVIINNDDSDIVYAAAMGSAWGPNAERGVYRTQDGGKTWEQVLFVNNSTGCSDLIVDPNNPNKLFAAMWEYGRLPWTFNSGGEGSGLYMTEDGGDNWTRLSEDSGLPKGELGRIGLTMPHSDSDIVYALIESKKTGLYKSEDGGYEWNLVSDENVGNRPFYYADIFVDPSNPSVLYNLYSVVSKSTDGGRSFDVILPYNSVHPDHHAFYIHPENSNYLIDGNDGGLSISRDGGESWEFINNLPLGQFYHISYDMDIPYNVYGGMQDNGSWQGPSSVFRWGSIRNEDWQEIFFGDGFDVVSKPGDSRYAYAMSQGGYVNYIDIETGMSEHIRPQHPDGKKLRFNWNAAISSDPHNKDGLYFGSQFVHYSDDCGANWRVISPDLTTNDSTKQKQAESGGLTIDATQAENFTSILCIAPSTMNKELIWASSDDGLIHVTRDKGATWKEVGDKLKGLPEGSWMPQIIPSETNEGEAFLVANNYRRNDWKPYAYHTMDYGASWNRIADESQVSGHVLSIVQDKKEPDLLFLGTENGLYVSIDRGENWSKWTHDYPSVSTMDLKIHPRESDLIIGTFGRACFILDNIEPLREVCKGNGSFKEKVKIFEPNTAYKASSMRPRGSRFAADHYWYGDNKRMGASFAIYFNEEVLPDEDSKGEKAFVRIYNSKGDTLRNIEFEPDTGIINVGWWFDTKGPRFPSRRPAKDEEQGGGPGVQEGNYKIVIEYGENADSTLLVVENDPRWEYPSEVESERNVLMEEWTRWVDVAGKTFDQIGEYQKSIAKANEYLRTKEDSTLKDLISIGDSLKTELVQLELLFMTDKDFKGYDHVTTRITDRIWRTRSYLDESTRMPGNSAEYSMNEMASAIEEALNQLEELRDTEILPWQEKVLKVEWNPFEEFEDLTIPD